MIKKLLFVTVAATMLLSVVACSMGGTPQVIVVTATSQAAEVLPTTSDQGGSNSMGVGGTALPTLAAPAGTIAQPPTQAVQSTAARAFTPEQFYTEQFEENSPTEKYYGGFTYSSDEIRSYLQGGKLWFEIKKDNWWSAITYDAYTYQDVALTVNVESRGTNANAVILMCRFNKGVGRYEFIIGSNGLYEIRDVHYENGVQAWDTITNGGSGKIKPGNAVNEYGISCQGQTLTLFINGSKAWKGDVSASLPQYSDGEIGFGATSENGTPVTIGFDWIKIEQP